MKNIHEYTKESYILEIKSTNKMDAIIEIANVLKNSTVCSDINALISALKEREEIMSTGIGFGIAIPHAKIPEIKDLVFAIGVSKAGIEFDSMDGLPVHMVVLVAAGENQHKDYLSLLSSLMTLLKNEEIKNDILSFKSSKDVYELIKNINK